MTTQDRRPGASDASAADEPALDGRATGDATVADPKASAENAEPAVPNDGSDFITLSTPDRSSTEAVIWPIRVAAAWAWRFLVVGAFVYFTLRLLDKISLVVFAVVIALFLTAVLHPPEKRLETLGLRKSFATALVLLAGVAVFGLIGWFVVVQITSHASTLGDQLTRVSDKIRDWLKNGPFHLNEADLDNFANSITNTIKNNQGKLVSGALTTAQSVFEFLGGLALAIFSAFFFLRDGDAIWRWVLRLVPTPARESIDHAGRRGWHSLGGYVRGQVLIALFHAVTITILLLVLRIPLAAALGVLIFLGSFIPILGLTISGALCVGVALLEHGVGAAIVVAVAIIVLVQAEGHLLQPIIMSRAVHIHPLAVVLAVAAGTTLYGIVGALIAVPLVAFLNSFIRGLRGAPADATTEGEKPSEPTAKARPRRRSRRGRPQAP
jgi:putative heme transporter